MTPTPAPPDVRPPDVRPPGPARRAGAWVRLGVVLALVAVAGVAAVQTARGHRETAADADRSVQAYEAALRAVPLLTDAEASLLRRSLNARHVALGESLGVAPRDALGGPADGLVRVDTSASFVALDGPYSDPLLTPDAAAALGLVAERFWVGPVGGSRFRLIATSLFRSAESQAALRGVNANAAAGRSSHEFGTTFDLAYRRFEPPPPNTSAVWISPRVPGPFRAAVARSVAVRVAAEHARLAREYPARLDATLGRALIALEDEGALVALRERNQPVYHVTVARRTEPDLGARVRE